MEKETIHKKIDIASQKVSDTNIGYATLNLEYLIKLIKTKKKENPDLSIQDIISEIENSYKKIAFSSYNGSSVVTRSDFCMLRALKYLLKNPAVILDTLDTSDRSLFIKTKDSYTSTPDIKQSIQELLKDACSTILSKYNIATKVRFVKGDFTIQERESLHKGTLLVLTQCQKIKEKQIKDSYTSVITEIAQVLDANGSFDKSTDSHNRRMRMLGLGEMQETTADKKRKSTAIDNMSSWKDPNIVGKLPLETLIMACAFFTNRLCKEYISFKKSVFLISELNFSEEDILKNKIVIPEELFSALVKYEFLQAEARNQFTKLQQQHTSSSSIINQVDYELDYEPQEYADYTRIFSTMLPNRANNLEIDSYNFMQFDNSMELLYQKKDMALDSLIIFLLDNEAKVNWGYIEEKTGNENSIERKKSMVALGFDFEKFNTSIRLHKSLEGLKKLISQCTGSDILPLYAGSEDWFVQDKFGISTDMTTQVVRMFTKPERRHLKEKLSTLQQQDRLHGFISHLNWLANGVTPQRYKTRNIVHLNTGKIEELDQIQH